jgi:hypothetical protein
VHVRVAAKNLDIHALSIGSSRAKKPDMPAQIEECRAKKMRFILSLISDAAPRPTIRYCDLAANVWAKLVDMSAALSAAPNPGPELTKLAAEYCVTSPIP